MTLPVQVTGSNHDPSLFRPRVLRLQSVYDSDHGPARAASAAAAAWMEPASFVEID